MANEGWKKSDSAKDGSCIAQRRLDYLSHKVRVAQEKAFRSSQSVIEIIASNNVLQFPDAFLAAINPPLLDCAASIYF
jgi:hypothetical protein